jgi:2-dehydropantoate 2-reductase
MNPTKKGPILIVGNGRMAQHIVHACKLKGAPHIWWQDARRIDDSFLSFYQEATLQSEPLFAWILVSDQAIEAVAHKLQALVPTLSLMHASGALSIRQSTALHPLFTFHKELYDLDTYDQIPFTLIGSRWKDEPPIDQWFAQYFSLNPRLEVPVEGQALYHALCVLVSNFPQILWSMSTDVANRQLHLDSSAFEPIILQAAKNFLSAKDQAITGPLVRDDQETIATNLKALDGSSLHGIYEAFKKAYTSHSLKS